ncbi:MAG: CoA transferase subunit A [Chloroflexi bacterium]|nr:CoA transferase subunit A [Chloroflexota bacterium]
MTVLSMQEAAQLVQSGMTVGLGGMTLYRRPVAFIRELLRRPDRPTNLTLLNFTSSYETDLLVGAGMVGTSRTCYFGMEAFGLAPMFTEAGNRGEITIIEETEMSIALGLRATMSGVGFLPAFAWLGTDMLKLRPDIKTIEDPYSGETLVAFPALKCDAAVIHGLRADRRGNVLLNQHFAIDRELVLVADTVIVTVEDIVDDIGPHVHIPGVVVDVVVHAPQGAYPTSCYPLYPISGEEILDYVDTCQAGDFEKYVARMLSDEWYSAARVE